MRHICLKEQQSTNKSHATKWNVLQIWTRDNEYINRNGNKIWNANVSNQTLGVVHIYFKQDDKQDGRPTQWSHYDTEEMPCPDADDVARRDRTSSSSCSMRWSFFDICSRRFMISFRWLMYACRNCTYHSHYSPLILHRYEHNKN